MNRMAKDQSKYYWYSISSSWKETGQLPITKEKVFIEKHVLK